MAVREDRRPTLASWPRRIYDWAELPPPFRPALEGWIAQGLPPGHVTYIPQVRQGSGGPEYATAWRGREVLVQTLRAGRAEARLLGPGDVAQVRYQVRLLRCDVTALPRGGPPVSFFYNKTKEDQLLPVLNLLLGAPPDFAPPARPDTPAWARLRAESYAMYFTSLLCERLGGAVRDFWWFRGRSRSLLYLLRKMPDPEYFLAATDRGLAVLETDFYGTRAACLPWAEVQISPPGEDGETLAIAAAHGPGVTLPLLPGQAAEARAFLRRLTTLQDKENCV